MKVNQLIFVSLLLLSTSQTSFAKQSIHWGTDEWQNMTQQNGYGFYHDLMNAIFPPKKFDLSVSYFPWPRVIFTLDKKAIDMTGALPARAQYHQSSQPVLSETIKVVVPKAKLNDFQIDNIKQYRGSWRKGYKEDIVHYVLTPPVPGTYVSSIKQAFEFMLTNKVDYYLDIDELVSKELAHTDETFHTFDVGFFHLYWTFSNTEKGKALKSHFDKQWRVLSNNGRLSALYKKYGLRQPANSF